MRKSSRGSVCILARRGTICLVPKPEDDIIDFVDDPSPTPVKKQTVVAPLPVYDPAHPPVLSYRAAQREKPPPADIETIKDQHLPLGLLAAGVVIQLLWVLIFGHHILHGLLELMADLTVGTGIMLGAMLLAAKLRGLQLGKLPVVIYKMAALSVAPEALSLLIAPLIIWFPFGFVGVWIVQFILFFALLGAMFDLEEADNWFCVWTIFLARLAFYFLTTFVLGK